MTLGACHSNIQKPVLLARLHLSFARSVFLPCAASGTPLRVAGSRHFTPSPCVMGVADDRCACASIAMKIREENDRELETL